MEQVSEVADVYRKEFEETYESLRQRGSGLQTDSGRFIEETQAQLEPTKQETINALTDLSDLQTPARPVVEAFAWGTVLVLGASLGSLFGCYVFGPFIGLFVGKFGAALLAYFALPCYGNYYVKNALAENTADSTVRFGLLSIALGMGTLSGHVLSECFLSAQPLALLTPLVIASTYNSIAQSVGASRVNLLAGCLSAALGVNLALGLVAGYLTLPYVTLSCLYVLCAAVIMQFMFKNIQAPETRVHLYQLAILTCLVVSKAAVFGLFGSAEYVEETNTEKAQ